MLIKYCEIIGYEPFSLEWNDDVLETNVHIYCFVVDSHNCLMCVRLSALSRAKIIKICDAQIPFSTISIRLLIPLPCQTYSSEHIGYVDPPWSLPEGIDHYTFLFHRMVYDFQDHQILLCPIFMILCPIFSTFTLVLCLYIYTYWWMWTW